MMQLVLRGTNVDKGYGGCQCIYIYQARVIDGLETDIVDAYYWLPDLLTGL